uniref:5'-3' DNA helicase ZGRF1-like N-terminal domain-containing protein n=1 Tax=Athene cunicularia TaxID=194338 RepID=A0A663MKN0_ATHCN
LESVLYTHQKIKKSKTWQDGILRTRTGGNKVNNSDLIPLDLISSATDGLSVGFQGPRQVEKKITTMEDGEKTILPLSKQCQGTFPSKFYSTSPLFSMVCKKDTETSLPADVHEDSCTDDDREHMSLSSLLSASFLDRCEETEKRNCDQSTVKPESPLNTWPAKSSNQAAGHRAVSHNIRSTAQIIALLNSKPTQGFREQTTSEVTECPSRFQASENTDSLYNQKSTILPAFSGDPAKRLVQNTQHLPFMKGTANDTKECNVGMFLNSAEQPCDKEDIGQRHDKKASNISQDLQDPCSTNSCFLPESTISRMSYSQFVPSSGDISCLASPITFENNLSRYRELSVSNGLKENSSVKLQSEPRQNSERVPYDLELSVDVTSTKNEIVKEILSMHDKDCGTDEQVMKVNFNLMESFDFNDTGNEDLCERDVNKLAEGDMLSQSPDCLKEEDVAQNCLLRLHSCCEVVTHGKTKEVKCSTFDGEDDGNDPTGGMSTQLCDHNVGDTGRIAEDSANQTRIEVELVGDGCSVKEINESQLSVQATNNKKDLDGCAVHTINGTSWIKSRSSGLLPGDRNVNECDPKSNMFEKTESMSCVSTSGMISAMNERTKEGVIQLGCRKSPDVALEHFWGTKHDDVKPGSSLLALSQKLDPSYDSLQYIAEDHQKVFGISHEDNTLISRSSICPLGKGPSSPEETAIGETAFENVESINAFEACKGERIGLDCLKCMAMADNSSDLPDLANNIALLRALTQHSTALESLQKMVENNSIAHESETSKEIFEPLVKDEG